ncbi:hypothetical protein EDD22DRAFT_961450 [Suillus occidentalis]|nr:hypothetical protein EDD22DRAFT_961450 [Suillus occidentalis]
MLLAPDNVEVSAAPSVPSSSVSPPPVGDTPIKLGSSTMLPFTTHTRFRLETVNAMGYEMKDKIVGPMPVEEFLEEFLPSSQIPDYDASSFTSAFTPGMFNNTLSAVGEQNAYKPFNDTMKSFAPQLSFIDSHSNADTANCSSFTFSVKPDVCVYADPTLRGTDISKAEIIIEFKWAGYSHDSFIEDGDDIVSSTENSMDTLGQITSYAAAQLGAQYRSHAFSVLIVRDRARIIRWDREGAIISSCIRYNTEPHLADFFYRYARASPELRGIDTSVSPASAREAALARLWLKLSNTTRMFKVSVPRADGSGVLTLIIPQPTALGFPPAGRGTRTCPAFDLVNKKVVMFKDSWRVSLPDVLPEGEVYKLLKSHNVRNVATCIAYHDVPFSIPQQLNQTVKFSSATWACRNTVTTPHILHRLVLDIVGRKLTKFESSHQLVQSIRDALIAHKDTHDLAKLLHRDLSVGNVVIHDGIGILIDWDLAKLITIQGPRQKNRTGTWQFMSAYLVAHSDAIHRVEDDLESSLYVLLWTALKHSITHMNIEDRTKLLTQVFDGGSSKEGWLMTRTHLPPDVFLGRKSLDNLVIELCTFFSHRYTKIPDEEKVSLASLRSVLQKHKDGPLYMAVQDYVEKSLAYKNEMAIKLLSSHDSVISIYDKYLQEPGWPEDPAVEQEVLQNKPGVRMITKSIVTSRAEITPTGKRRRLDDIMSDDDSGSHDGETSSVTSLDELSSLSSDFNF